LPAAISLIYMTEPEKNIVRLKIISSRQTAQQITETIGLACDRSWSIGDRRGKTGYIHKNYGWVLNSNLPESTGLEEHVKKLLERLSPYEDKIRMVAELECVEFSCVIYAPESPALNFSKEVVGKISNFGAGLDVDLYLG